MTITYQHTDTTNSPKLCLAPILPMFDVRCVNRPNSTANQHMFWRSLIHWCWTSSIEQSASWLPDLRHYTQTISTSTHNTSIWSLTAAALSDSVFRALCINSHTYLLNFNYRYHLCNLFPDCHHLQLRTSWLYLQHKWLFRKCYSNCISATKLKWNVYVLNCSAVRQWQRDQLP